MSAATTPQHEEGPQQLQLLRAGSQKGNHSMKIVQQSTGGELFTTSQAIAEGAGVQHKNTLELIERSRADLEDFGTVAFETRPFETAGGTQLKRIARLNEQQATLLLTYLRNTDQVRTFKKMLVRAFYEMARQFQAGQPPLSPAEQMAQGLIAAQQMLDEKSRELEEAKPKAEFAETFLSANGDYDTRDAAQILRRDHDITDIGQNRLRDWMQRHGWIDHKRRPYQHKIDADHLRLKPSSFKFKRTNGEEQLADPQLRVTPKGVEALARAMKARQTMEAVA